MDFFILWEPVLLVAQKKDSLFNRTHSVGGAKRTVSWLFCVHYRCLNALTVKSIFPVPVFDRQEHFRPSFSCMDLLADWLQEKATMGELVQHRLARAQERMMESQAPHRLTLVRRWRLGPRAKVTPGIGLPSMLLTVASAIKGPRYNKSWIDRQKQESFLFSLGYNK